MSIGKYGDGRRVSLDMTTSLVVAIFLHSHAWRRTASRSIVRESLSVASRLDGLRPRWVTGNVRVDGMEIPDRLLVHHLHGGSRVIR